ncbi:MAG: ABC transporter permease [Clostridium sp.]|nr:ABC transporter permease [Bacteroides sp.]MCM1198960.1 ABC transporter permease [Clostridium sp.]
MDFLKNLRDVVRREVRIIRQRPIYLISSVAVMAFCSIFFLTLLRDGQPKDLPVGIVDYDNSSVSRNFTRQLDATQTCNTVQFSSFKEAREAMQTGKVSAICVIPENMAEDIQSNRRPVFTFYVNTLYFVSGTFAYKTILTMVNLTGGAVKREVLRARGANDAAIMGRIQPIKIDAHQIGNSTANYSVYLNNVLLPGILELSIILVLVYSLGAELKYGTSRHLMQKAGGSMGTALLGKLIPYTLLFWSIGILMNLLLYHWCKFPLAGSIWNMFLGTMVFVLSCEAIAVTIIGLLPVLRDAISIAAIYSVLGFSLTGFTFPVEAMAPYIQGLAAAFPLRHYYMFYIQEAMYGTGFAGWHMEIVHLLLFLFVPLISVRRLEKAYVFQNFPRK